MSHRDRTADGGAVRRRNRGLRRVGNTTRWVAVAAAAGSVVLGAGYADAQPGNSSSGNPAPAPDATPSAPAASQPASPTQTPTPAASTPTAQPHSSRPPVNPVTPTPTRTATHTAAPAPAPTQPAVPPPTSTPLPAQTTSGGS